MNWLPLLVGPAITSAVWAWYHLRAVALWECTQRCGSVILWVVVRAPDRARARAKASQHFEAWMLGRNLLDGERGILFVSALRIGEPRPEGTPP